MGEEPQLAPTSRALDFETVRPRRGGASTSQGRPYTIFRRALERKNLLVAEATAKELPPLNLTDALELTVLIARKDPRRHPRVAARWLMRYLEGRDDVTIEDAAMAASCLAALGGDGHEEAARTLRALAERATKQKAAQSPEGEGRQQRWANRNFVTRR